MGILLYLIDVKTQTFVHPCDRILDVVPVAADQVVDVVVVAVEDGRADILAQRFGRTRLSGFTDQTSSSETSCGGVLDNGLDVLNVLDDVRFLDGLSVLGTDGDLSCWSPKSGMLLGWFGHLFFIFFYFSVLSKYLF